MASSKRPRASSSSSSLATSPEPSQTTPTTDPPPSKASRIHPSESSKSPSSPEAGTISSVGDGNRYPHHPILCNLPPTCQSRPTPIPNTMELERHYAMFHAHVCQFDRCGCVFPEERFLELHQTECHDPIAAIRKERHEKIFECHIPAPTCGRKFATPKTRRLHLIQAHNYPKQYFFAVTNKGIGGLLKKWGEGASLIRKEWKPRSEGSMKMDQDHSEDNDDVHSFDLNTDEDEDGEPADLDATPRIGPRRRLSPSTSQQFSSLRGSEGHKYSKHAVARGGKPQHKNAGNADITSLTQSLDALSLVPHAVRFGRGGKARGFAQSGSVGRSLPMEVDRASGSASHGGQPGRGRGLILRGRGGFRPRGF